MINLRYRFIQMQQIVALRFQCQDVGRHVAGSKKRYTWQFSLKDKLHTIILDFSIISGKLKITVDRKILLQNQLPSNVAFQYPFTLDGFALNIIQQGETFELRLNNKVFSHLYTQQKTNTEFKKYESQIKDIKVDLDQLNTGNKRISLNIGAFGGMNKKKKEVPSQSQGWNAFAGNSSFPSYFGQPSAVEQKPKQTASPVKQIKQVVKTKTSLLDDDEPQQTVKTETSSNIGSIGNSQMSSNSDQLLFQFGQATVPPPLIVNSGEQFGNMQQLFKSLNINSQPQPVNNQNQIDFFAEQPQKESSFVSVPIPQVKNNNDLTNLLSENNPTFNFSGTGPISSAYTTGYAFNGGINQANPKTFATTNFNISKTGQFDLSSGFAASQPPKVQQLNFGKKSSNKELVYANTLQTNSAVQNETKPPPEVSLVNNPLTDININDFNTMQKLFQTNNFNQNDMFNFAQPVAQQSPPVQAVQPQVYQQSQLNQAFPNNTPNDTNSFNTMQLLFTTTNYTNLNENQSRPQPTVTPPKSNPLDMFSNNKPATFSTMSGATNNNAGFDMLNFGTMQLNASNSQPAQFSFPKTKEQIKPVFKKQSPISNDLI